MLIQEGCLKNINYSYIVLISKVLANQSKKILPNIISKN
jgi:hypothetical protein